MLNSTGIQAALQSNEPIRWSTIGDSIAQGAHWTGAERDYVQLLEERVRYELTRYGDSFVRWAVSGANTEDTLGRLPAALDLAPDLVVIGVGTNDAKAGADGVTRFAERYGTLLTTILDTGALVVAQTPTAVLRTCRYNLGDHLPAYADAIRAVAEQHDVPLVDHFARWTAAGDGWAPAEWMADPTHPSGRGHRVIARTLFESLGLFAADSACCRLLD
ncbi:lysophospholipase L1-like esterase [Kribbella aluminosa]|uniref:Lysophospholipase L1-like esterase n=1 Tax=Kribbella aluminosa TaxID=416017 RepID=A0ABS4UKC8_9ACTN|nr:SGNH/GDSL hydrolase family protein [Kribbella aluminosa]MBP2352093.1 lysophospholipase L1-like esterase [Kribbella aluminosa]